MSGARDNEPTGKAADEAARWFTRLQDEAATRDDWLAFETWLAASPAHAAAYERLEALWVDLDNDDARAALNPPVSLAERRLSRRGWLAAGGALAAGLAAAVVIGVEIPREAPAQVYATAPGQTRDLALADGTRVRLNAGSRLAVRLERRARHVEMAEGEAAFDVTHDPDRPFLIEVADREVRVVGTEFNLRHRAGHVALTVRRGVVEVRPAGKPHAAPVRVAAGHRLTHHVQAGNSVLSTEPPDAAFAWTEGRLVYTDAPLSEVAADLSRSLGAPVRVADPATGAVRFTGVLVLDDKPTVLRRLAAFAPVRIDQTPDAAIIRRR
jgi:transmembrane sensor